MNKALSMLAGSLLLALPTAMVHADDVKVHAPNDYLTREALLQVEALLKRDDALTWRKDSAGKPLKLVTVTRKNASTVHVSAKFYHNAVRPIFGMGRPTGSGVPMRIEGNVDADLDIQIKCANRHYQITTNDSLKVVIDLVGIGLYAPDVTRLQDDLEHSLSNLPRQLEDTIYDATVALGVPSEVMCKSVVLGTSGDLDLGFEIGQCLDGDEKHSACTVGMLGDGMDFTCRERVWVMSKHDCRTPPNHDPINSGNTSNPHHDEP